MVTESKLGGTTKNVSKELQPDPETPWLKKAEAGRRPQWFGDSLAAIAG
jgi:hypothetical protein